LEVDNANSSSDVLPARQQQTTATIGVTTLATIVFFNVSGGPFGIEESVRSAGFLFSILGFAVFPFVWSIPESLVTAELGSTYPEASGGVAWVENAFGKFAGWQAGYLGWVSGATDNAIYPVLFLEYVVQLWSSAESIHPLARFITISSVSAALGFQTYLGLDVVGNMSVLIGILSMSPFLVMVMMGTFKLDPSRWLETMAESSSPSSPTYGILWRPFLNNLFWNLNSFDSAASYSGEVDNPGKTMPRAMLISVVMVISCYLLPLMVAIGATDSLPQDWVDGYLATAAGSIGGKWLEGWVVLAAAVANISLFQAELSADAYQLCGMAERGFVPEVFSRRSRHGTPTYAILLGVTVIVVMGNLVDLEAIIEMLNLNYAISLIMEYGAFVKLRMSKPQVHRPFRIPFGTAGCIALLSLPVTATLAVILVASYKTLAFSVVVNLIGVLLYI
ncbi:MAG: hypothetical protein SGILL_005579, partial [Bacillariaceae sp.]